MSRYVIIKIICFILIVLTVAVGGYITLNYLVEYHRADLADKVFKHTDLKPTAEPGIKTAVDVSGEMGSPYDIEGILPIYNGYADNVLSVKIIATNDIGVELLYLTNEDETFKYPFDEKTFLEATTGTPVYIKFDFYNVDDAFVKDLDEIYVKYRYDDGIIHSMPLTPFTLGEYDAFDSTLIRTDDNISEFDCVSVKDDIVTFTDTVVTIDKPLFIPEGLTLDIQKGQKIDITDEAFIVCYSTILCKGTDREGIQFYSSDGTGRGLFVCKADETSYLEYTSFDGLNTPKSGIWGLTGAVTFYESDVEISNCAFTNNTCEDGLNIVRSNFNISDSFFNNTFGDAFDSDFSIGGIFNSTFINTGNDAVDVSTTQLTLGNIIFNHIGDKAVSGGEKSTIDINDIKVSDAVIGIASKDMSEITCDNAAIADTTVAITLYQKKPEFGPAKIVGNDIILSGSISIDYLIEKKSTLIIDGEEIFPRSDTKESILFEKMINGEPIR